MSAPELFRDISAEPEVDKNPARAPIKSRFGARTRQDGMWGIRTTKQRAKTR